MAKIPANMEEQIDQIKKLEISYRKLHDTAIIQNKDSTAGNIEIPFQSILAKYKNFLNTIVITVDFDDDLSRRYLYNPKLMSYEFYGTVEFWAELLRLNHCSSTVMFKPKDGVKFYDINRLKTFINEIMILEKVIS
jgi:hypothetical protein